MSEEVKFIITAVVTPLIGGIVALAVFIFNLTVKHLRSEVKSEKAAREKAEQDRKDNCAKCNLDIVNKIEHNRKNIGKLFDDVEEVEKKVIETNGRIATIEGQCQVRHRWDGNDRRNNQKSG